MPATYDHAAHAASFGTAAEAYERGRPGYPGAALDWLLPPGARQVLDLGAGTGKLTSGLVGRGLDVVAVEPSEPMLDRLRTVVPGARALVGTAEQIPLPDASTDVVLVAQAWHWVDPARAVPEIARVLRAGGILGLLWNLRDNDAGWSSALSGLLDERTDNRDGSLDLDELHVGEPFDPLETHEVAWTHHLSRDQVVDTVASRSYVITLPASERQDLLDQVRHLLDTHPDLTGTEQVAMHYVTRCYRTQRSRHRR